MMKSLRATFRLLAIVLITSFLVLIFIVGKVFFLNNTNGKIRLKNFLMSKWAAVVAKVMGLEINVSGTPPAPPFLLVSNHLSYVDIIPFWRYLKTTFIAKDEINSWPVIGWVANLLGIVFINRENNRDLSRVNKHIAKNINMEQGLIFFPEGTSSRGAKVLPFKSSLLHYPAIKEFPVHFASISYHIKSNSGHRAGKEICWWGDMDFALHFWNLLKIKSFEARLHFGKTPIQSSDRKELAYLLQKKVKTKFIATDQSPHIIES